MIAFFVIPCNHHLLYLFPPLSGLMSRCLLPIRHPPSRVALTASNIALLRADAPSLLIFPGVLGLIRRGFPCHFASLCPLITPIRSSWTAASALRLSCAQRRRRAGPSYPHAHSGSGLWYLCALPFLLDLPLSIKHFLLTFSVHLSLPTLLSPFSLAFL